MKNLKFIFTSVLIILILFAGSCATKKRAYKDMSSGGSPGNTSQAVKAPASVSGVEEFVYEFDVMVDVDPQKMAEPRPDYPDAVSPSETRSADMYGLQSQQSQFTSQQSQLSQGAGSDAEGTDAGSGTGSAGNLTGGAAGSVGAGAGLSLQGANAAGSGSGTAGTTTGGASIGAGTTTGSDGVGAAGIAGSAAGGGTGAGLGSAGTTSAGGGTGTIAAGSLSTTNLGSAGTGAAGDRAFGSPGGPGGRERRNSNLVSPGSVNVEGVMDYIKIRNRNPVLNEESTRRIINSYIDEAVKEDINYDFAIAQMLYWTAFLTNKQRVETNNLAGLQTTNTWGGTFKTPEDGVKAHIQHLRGYSHGALKNPNADNIDPRWNHISSFRGTIKNFEQIYPRWSASTARYRRNIILILNDMYRYSDRYSSLYR